MIKPVTINKEKPPYKSMDYEALRKEGIEHISKLSGAVWTDYNDHDPGITMLEYLSFGITDIGYRCNFPITDLLYSRENRSTDMVDNAFIPPEKILPCAALTIDDYRKLILDKVKEVDNVWIEQVTDQKEKFKGLYDIRLQINKEQQQNSTPENIKNKVAEQFRENRNLCEDIRDIYVLSQEYLEIEAKVDLEGDASAEQTLADIIHELEHFLAPKIVFYSQEEMLASGMDINTLFDGPLTEKGFIKTAELASQITRINISQLRDTIASIVGVRSIDQIQVKLNGLPYFDEEISISSRSYFVLGDSMKLMEGTAEFPIGFRRNNQLVKPNLFQALQMLKTHIARDSQNYLHKLHPRTIATTTQKDLADIGAYYSIQRFFPAVYGIGAYGLPREANLLRKSQARQLKGYLAVFETMFSSYLRQLTQIRHLFSIGTKPSENEANNVYELKTTNRLDLDSAEAGPSYFARFPIDIPDIESLIALDGETWDWKTEDQALARNSDLYQDHFDTSNVNLAIEKKLAENTALFDQVLDRRNEFLDHLLARFGESISGEWLNAFVANPNDLSLLKKSMIKTKCRILQEYETLSRDRGKGFNYRAKDHVKESKLKWRDMETDNWTSHNVSGLKKRLSYWINLPSYADRSLTGFFPFEQFDLKKRTDASTQTETQPNIPLKAILQHGWNIHNYSIAENENNAAYKISIQAGAQGVRYPLLELESLAEAEATRDRFIDAVHAFNLNSRGFFVVEHLLLRPLHQGGYKLILDIAEQSVINENSAESEKDSDPFESLGYASREEMDGLAEDLLLIVLGAREKHNYEVLPDGPKYFIVITQNKRPVLVSAKSYESKDKAESVLKQLTDKMMEVLKPAATIQNHWIQFMAEPVAGMGVENAFYAHRLSIVLPNWPGIFMDQRFKDWFKQLVAQNIPAHLRADMLWLDWSEMKAFEDTYQKWLLAKSEYPMDIDKLDQLSFDLLEKLMAKGPAKEPLDALKEKQANSGVSKSRLEAIMKHFKRFFLFNPADLQIIEGIDETVEYWLKKENISTWALLRIAPDSKLEAVWKKAGLTGPVDTASWKVQAMLAAEGKWDDLLKLQKLNDSSRGSLRGQKRNWKE
jgi:hypothetical protein